ncbi:MAG: hypothetical protein ACR2FF_06410 [Mycobacteriales bacterium]
MAGKNKGGRETRKPKKAAKPKSPKAGDTSSIITPTKTARGK